MQENSPRSYVSSEASLCGKTRLAQRVWIMKQDISSMALLKLTGRWRSSVEEATDHYRPVCLGAGRVKQDGRGCYRADMRDLVHPCRL